MKQSVYLYEYDGKNYPVIVTKKRIKRSHFRFREGTFYVSMPLFIDTKREVFRGLDQFAGELIKKGTKYAPKGDDYYYILGKKVNISETGTISFSSGYLINYVGIEDLEKKLKIWFKSVMENRQRYYEKIMDVKPYKVLIRKMITRFGVNSLKPRRITYTYDLLHYPIEVIDTVIVHELCHEFIRNHSEDFYNLVNKYCPNYQEMHKHLVKGEFYVQVHQE